MDTRGKISVIGPVVEFEEKTFLACTTHSRSAIPALLWILQHLKQYTRCVASAPMAVQGMDVEDTGSPITQHR